VIQSGDWQLWVASIKSMAAVFTAFDHHTTKAKFRPLGRDTDNAPAL